MLKYLLTPNKVIPVWLERKEKEDFSKIAPFSVELHLTSKCNYSCYHCSYVNRRQKKMSLQHSMITKLLYDLINLKVKGVYFSGGGEPTLLPRWEEYIDTLISHGINVALITNGSLIKEQNLSLLARLNYIAISIYGVRESTVRNIIGVRKNIFYSFELPIQIKKKSEKVIVGARCVINKFNYSEVIDIYNRAIGSGYDYIIFIPAVDYERRGIALTSNELTHLKQLVSSAKIDSKNTNLLSLAKREFSFYERTIEEEVYKNIECQNLKLRLTAFVNYDGGVYLCQPHIGNSRYCIGNLYDDSFQAIWNSPQHLKVIDRLLTDWKRGKCINCRAINYNRTIYNYEIMPLNTPIEIVKDYFL